MPRKVIPLVSGEIYHIYNRGVDKRVVFKNRYDFERFLNSIKQFNTIEPIGSLYELKHAKHTLPTHIQSLVQIHAYCLLPNHFHLILSQTEDGRISEFMKRLGGGYTSYFNEQYKRSGSLFQGTFKRVLIETDEQLQYVTAYVNLNNVVHGIEEENVRSSLSNYTGLSLESFVKPIFSNDSNNKNYYKIAKETVDEIRRRRQSDKVLEAAVANEYLE